jgi:cytochrome c oxidase subunit 2
LGHLLPTTLAFFTPQSGGSPNANEIDSLYKILLAVALVIFVVVMSAMTYALIRFRARRGSPRPRSAATPAWRSAGRPARR